LPVVVAVVLEVVVELVVYFILARKLRAQGAA
jgi:hypothetical protein